MVLQTMSPGCGVWAFLMLCSHLQCVNGLMTEICVFASVVMMSKGNFIISMLLWMFQKKMASKKLRPTFKTLLRTGSLEETTNSASLAEAERKVKVIMLL